MDYDEDNFGGTNIALEINKIIGDISSFAGQTVIFSNFPSSK